MFISRVRVRQNIRELSHLSSLLRHNGYGSHQLLYDLFPKSESRDYLFREEIAKEQLGFQHGAKGEPVYYLVSKREPSLGSPLFFVESKLYQPKLAIGDRLSFSLRANPTVTRKANGRKNSIRHDVVMDAQRAILHDLAQMLGVSTDGGKTDLKRRVLTEWSKSDNQAITSCLAQAIGGNERYENLLNSKMKREDLCEAAIKASTDKALENWFQEKGRKKGFRLVSENSKGNLKFQAEGYRWHPLSRKGKNAGFSSVDFAGELEVTDSNLFLDVLYNGIGPAKAFGCGLMLVKRE